jgi:hypothetical protein
VIEVWNIVLDWAILGQGRQLWSLLETQQLALVVGPLEQIEE